jgi:SAM-dependent methyltransferase
VYQQVVETAAHELPFADSQFGSCFANCALEHMNELPRVLSSIARVLRPGAPFVLSVVTDNFPRWSSLADLVSAVGEPRRAEQLGVAFKEYHHLMNPLPADGWSTALREAGFELLDYVPILPELTSRLFLLIDQLWHVPTGPLGEEVGGQLQRYLSGFEGFPRGFSASLRGMLEMERDWTVTSGAVFRVRRLGSPW